MQAISVPVDGIETEFSRLRNERTELRRDRAALASLPAMMEMIDNVKRPLDMVDGSSLDNEVLAVLESERVTVHQLRKDSTLATMSSSETPPITSWHRSMLACRFSMHAFVM